MRQKTAKLSKEALAAANLRGLTLQRNEELIKYQREIKLNRAKLIAEFKGQETDSQREERRRLAKRQQEDAAWKRDLATLRKAYANPKHPLNADRHPCRPKIDHGQSLAERQLHWQSHWQALERVRLMRKKYAAVLAEEMQGKTGSLQPTGWITRDNLQARIQWALDNPVSFNVQPEQIIGEEEALCERLRQVWVEDDKPRMPAPEQFAVKK